MPVHAPHPRLYSSVPFHHLAQVGHGSGKAVNVSLNVTPFVDMMTILVTFLLMMFSATGELAMPKDVTLPQASSQDEVRRALQVGVSAKNITVGTGDQEKVVAYVADVEQLSLPIITSLKDELEIRKKNIMDGLREGKSDQGNARELKEKCDKPVENPTAQDLCVYRVAILLADRDIPAKVMNMVILTMQTAGFDNVLPAVASGSGE